MPSTVELVSSGTLTAGSDISRVSEEQIWESWDYASAALAETAVLSLSPRPFGMLLRDISTTPKDGQHEDIWQHTLRYEFPTPFESDPENPPDPGDPPTPPTAQVNFDIGRKTRRVTRAIGERKYGIQSQLPDFHGGIDWDGERFRGADIIEPFFSFDETHYFNAADVDNAYVQAISDLVGKTNDAPFRGFDAGEVLFLGARGAQRNADFFEITFLFAVKRNQTAVTIGDTINIDVGGWEESWEYFGQAIDLTTSAVVPNNIGVYVDQLYYPGAYGALQIGA